MPSILSFDLAFEFDYIYDDVFVFASIVSFGLKIVGMCFDW
jgi:hypothetical protein